MEACWDEINKHKFTYIQSKRAKVINHASDYFNRIGHVVDVDTGYGLYILDFARYGKGFFEDELEFIQ